MCTLDTLLYMHKTAYTLLSIDYIEMLKDAFSYTKSKKETWNDNLISQFIETSYAYGFEVINVEKNEDIWEFEIVADIEQEKEGLIKYCTIISRFLECYKMTIYRMNKVEYKVQFVDGKLEVLKYKV